MVCVNRKKKYFEKQHFIVLPLKLLCKTSIEAAVDSMGFMLQKHMKPECPATQSVFENEMYIGLEWTYGINSWPSAVYVLGQEVWKQEALELQNWK